MSSEAPSCLILGAEGFVGSAFVSAARARGWDPVLGTRASSPGLRGRRFDLIVNANGNARKYLARADPSYDYRATVESVRESLRSFECGRYVLISSVDVYPTPAELATTHELADIDPEALDVYGRHKRLAEQAVIEAAPSWLILRLAQMLGPGLAKGPIFDLVQGSPVWVDLASRYPFLGVDVVARVGLALATDADDRCYNLCGRGSASLHEAVELLGVAAPGEHPGERRRETYRIDTRRLEALHPLPSSTDELRRFAIA